MVSKWRPSEDQNIYVIPDIHGNYDGLELLLNKITPLRKKTNDLIVFIGDYVDRSIKSKETLDLIINLKSLYGDKIITLGGNHEEMMINALGLVKENEIFEKKFTKLWLFNGGAETVMSYTGSSAFSRKKMLDSMPIEHIEFLKSCLDYYETDKYIFVHGGCDPFKPLAEQSPSNLKWDRSLVNIAKACYLNNITTSWKKTIICGHSGPNPILLNNYAMLDVGSPARLICYEANSRKAILAEKNSKNVTKFEI